MGKLIDDLLEFSRTSRAEMKCVRVNMHQLVVDVRRLIEREPRENSITWEVADLPAVDGDVALLKQVWTNLLSNAAKYTRKTSPAIVRIGATPRDGEMEFFVQDNGAGFDMNYVHKLFGVFSRLHHQSEFEGTGIGLANAKRIVTRHGGRIWAQGQLNAGATFYFTLPVAK
jgi:light-regulated signal transduction histidine kinase (bacteriophytochrome)